jgi:NTP pyrophosphatase (non-canonical NTP hydrolase)
MVAADSSPLRTAIRPASRASRLRSVIPSSVLPKPEQIWHLLRGRDTGIRTKVAGLASRSEHRQCRREASMRFDDYQQTALRTAIYAERHRIIYPALGLASEAGEVAGKIKKVLRDQEGDFAKAPIEAIRDELGDVLWYVAVLAADLGLSLEQIAADNVAKLAARRQRGTIGGAGDHR